MTGQDFTVYDRSCNQLQRITTKQFFTNAGGTITGITHEPRVLYDASIGRWIITTCDNGTGNNYVAVSAGTNPISSNTSAWKLTTVPPSGFRDDFLRPAWDVNGVYVTYVDTIIGGNFDKVSVFKPSDLQWSGSGSIAAPSGGVFKGLEFELFPSTDTNPSKLPTDPELLVFREVGSGSPQNGNNVPFNLILRRIVWSGGVAKTDVATASSGYLYKSAAPIVQPGGGSIRPQENHRGSAYLYNGVLYVVIASGPCASGCTGGQPKTTHNGFFWFKIDPVSRTILDKGYLFDSSMDHSFATIVVDGGGNVVIVDTCSDASTRFASVCAFYRRPSDPAGQLTGPTILAAGTNTYAPGCAGINPSGWGLWNATVIDPLDSTKIWTFAEYGEFATACAWATRIVKFQVQPATATRVTINDVVNGASFLPGLTSGAWATIRGQNLSSTTRSWQASDFNGTALPTSLDGVSVMVNGLAAYVSFISPTQINFLAPDDSTTGSVNVQVSNPFGDSNVAAVSETAVSPALFQFSPKYPAAVHANGSYVGAPGLLSGSAFAPAVPGETIMLFGTGFGPANPALPAAQLVALATPLASSVTVSIGGKPATVVYAGLSGSGLNQLNVVVPPDVPAGDQAIIATVNGSQSQPGMFLTVQGPGH
jgi:uncharacterized protein (TIGR03437 family)